MRPCERRGNMQVQIRGVQSEQTMLVEHLQKCGYVSTPACGTVLCWRRLFVFLN